MSRKRTHKRKTYVSDARGSLLDKWKLAPVAAARRKLLAYETAQFIATIVAASQKRLARIQIDLRKQNAKHSVR
jgi:hypothetical protein